VLVPRSKFVVRRSSFVIPIFVPSFLCSQSVAMPIDADAHYCYLITTGRTSGQPREIEIWFGLIGSMVYMLSGSGEDEHGPKAHWARNILKTPMVTVRINETTYPGTGRIVERGTAEDAAARALVVPKYQPSSSNELTNWGKTALVVAVELSEART
jgi:hypothetical protein